MDGENVAEGAAARPMTRLKGVLVGGSALRLIFSSAVSASSPEGPRTS